MKYLIFKRIDFITFKNKTIEVLLVNNIRTNTTRVQT